MTKRLDNIDFLRIVFTICIVLCHAFGAVSIWNRAPLAVEFFFILSGFFLFYTYRPEKMLDMWHGLFLLGFYRLYWLVHWFVVSFYNNVVFHDLFQ